MSLAWLITSWESPKTFNWSTRHSAAIFIPLINASYSTMLLVHGKRILYALGSEYLCGIMNKIPAPDPYCVKELSKNITHVLHVSVKIDSSGKSMFNGSVLCIGASANWSAIACHLIALRSTYWMSNSLNTMTHLAKRPINAALLSKYFSGSIFATHVVS